MRCVVSCGSTSFPWLVFFFDVSRPSGLAKTILQGTVKGGRRQGRQRKKWEDNIREWTGLEFGKSQRAVENRKKMERTGCKIICGAPTTLAVKGLMMMMMMKSLEVQQKCLSDFLICNNVNFFNFSRYALIDIYFFLYVRAKRS